MQAAIDQRLCIHCGTPFRATARRPDFCCAGCQFVHGLITKNGLGQFYDLQEGGIPPVQSMVFQKRDYAWLEELSRTAAGKLTLDVQGISCLGCAWLIERLFQRHPGALAIHVDPTLGQVLLHWQPGVCDLVSFAREVQSFGYLLGPPGKASADTDRSLNLRLGICGALALNTMLFTLPRYTGMSEDFEFAALFHRLAFILATLSFLVGGTYFFVRSWRSLRQGILHIDLPISVGLLAAYVGSAVAYARGTQNLVYFDFVSTFAFLMLAGRWLQQMAIARNRHQLLAHRAEPPSVRLVARGKVSASRLVVGDLFFVEPGGIVPVLSRLGSEAATLGLDWISGESETAGARKGRLVPAGAINCGASPIELEARENWSTSLLARLLNLTPASAARDRTLERFLRSYVGVVFGLASLGALGWWLTTGQVLPALQVFVSVLVVSCPCASGVALPLCGDLATSRLRKLGVFIREGDLWSKLAHVRKIIFDKTGTLTLETTTLLNPETLGTLTPEERFLLLAMVQDSLHPISGCLREQLLADGVHPIRGGALTETVGFGLEMKRAGAIWRLGRPAWAAGDGTTSTAECLFTCDGLPRAAFVFGEMAREDARDEIFQLQKQGYQIFILSGDRRGKVSAMADCLDLPQEQCQGELTPDEKAARVHSLDAHDTLYLGDGANDSLAFDHAWLSGTPAIDRGLLEQKASFYFLGRGLSGVRALLTIAAQRRRAARAVVAFAIAYNAVAITICLAGRMNPLLAAVLMPASTFFSLGVAITLSRDKDSQTNRPRAGTRTGQSPQAAAAPLRAATW